MTERTGWIALAVAGVLAVASIAFFWLNLPEWGYCIEDGPHQGCEMGVFTSNAIAGTLAVLVGLVSVVVGLIVAGVMLLVAVFGGIATVVAASSVPPIIYY